MEFVDQDDDVSSVQSVEVAEMLRGLSAPYCKGNPNMSPPRSPRRAARQQVQIPPQTPSSVGGYEPEELSNHDSSSSWHFDLGPLKEMLAANNLEKSPPRVTKPIPPATSTAAETLSVGEEDDEDYDLGSISQDMLVTKATALLNNNTMTRRNFDQSHATFNSSVNHWNNSAPNSPIKTSELLDERRAARAQRMERVRQRIAREKEEAKQRKLDEEKRAQELFMSDDKRRQRMYEWYCRLGMPNRKELKKRVKAMKGDGPNKIAVQDVDLLPWNFSGSMVNTSKLHKLGISAAL